MWIRKARSPLLTRNGRNRGAESSPEDWALQVANCIDHLDTMLKPGVGVASSQMLPSFYLPFSASCANSRRLHINLCWAVGWNFAPSAPIVVCFPFSILEFFGVGLEGKMQHRFTAQSKRR